MSSAPDWSVRCSLVGLALEPIFKAGKWSLLGESLYVDTVSLDLALLSQFVESGHNVGGESEFTGDENLLATWELELSSSEGFLSSSNLVWLGSDGHKDGSNVDTGSLAETLSIGVSHTGLESISTSAGKHLVDADHMPWVDSDSNMETKFTCVDLHVLVSGNTSSLKCLRGDLLLLIGNQMDAAREFVPVGLLLSSVIDSNLWVWHSTVETRLWIRLVFLISVATRWSSTHFYKIITT